MNTHAETSVLYTPPASREERVREMSLSPGQVAARTGACVGFVPFTRSSG